MVSRDVQTPLKTILILLEGMVKSITDEKFKKSIFVVISQINLLICLFNDIIDLKMIEVGNFVTKSIEFRPIKTFEYVLKIF